MKVPLGLLLLIGMATAGSPSRDARAAEGDGNKPSNKLKWSTASEVGNFGYDVYRARNEKGPFERLTREPILGAGTTDLPSYYDFVDDTIEVGVAYYYYLESISMSGARERFTPVIRAKPKGKAGLSAEAKREDGDRSPPE